MRRTGSIFFISLSCIFLQTILAETSLVLVVKLLITLSGTFVFCFATYLVFVRYTPIGWMLNGKRAFP